ncbi:small glutamine-rich tetratricopeptide repeat-containing protein 2-like [Rutidosis leptorrhynchoides]|uniref:small glutamine-rich tetratricopeptide repeat-containing protein 2-like n=1 Tax=Rutidosis leptorrhynchoides TaxID=125765 RepID=UPI003A99F31F
MYTPDEAKDKARRLFNCALGDMEEYGVEVLNLKNLAEIFKLKGNDFMQFGYYSDAIFTYTVAIALCGDNAIYYCNRAAAYTKTKQYTEAISDCQKAIEIDPSYIKAYSRLGFVYFAQGNFNDAIHKGFKKALQLDPDNEAMKGNIQAAEKKLMEERERDSRSSSHNGDSCPQFDYPSARDSDRQMMNLFNEYNRRNHDIIAEQGFDGVSDRQIGNLCEIVRSIGQMVGADSIRISTTQDDDNNSPHGN